MLGHRRAHSLEMLVEPVHDPVRLLPAGEGSEVPQIGHQDRRRHCPAPAAADLTAEHAGRGHRAQIDAQQIGGGAGQGKAIAGEAERGHQRVERGNLLGAEPAWTVGGDRDGNAGERSTGRPAEGDEAHLVLGRTLSAEIGHEREAVAALACLQPPAGAVEPLALEMGDRAAAVGGLAFVSGAVRGPIGQGAAPAPPDEGQRADRRVDGPHDEAEAPERHARGDEPLADHVEETREVVAGGGLAQDEVDRGGVGGGYGRHGVADQRSTGNLAIGTWRWASAPRIRPAAISELSMAVPP